MARQPCAGCRRASNAAFSSRMRPGSMPCGSQPVRAEMVNDRLRDGHVRRRSTIGTTAGGLSPTTWKPSPLSTARRNAASTPPPIQIGMSWAGFGRNRMSRELVELAVERRRVVAPRHAQQIEDLVQALAPVAERLAERLVLALCSTRRRRRRRGGRRSWHRRWRDGWRARPGCAAAPRERSCRAAPAP